MKKLFFSLLLLPALLLAGCSSDDAYTPIEGPVEISVSKTEIINDGKDAVEFTVTVNGVDVTSKATIYNITKDETVRGKKFTSDKVGIFDFRAQYGNRQSGTKTILVNSRIPGSVPAPSTENTVLVYLGIDNNFRVDEDYEAKVEAMRRSFVPEFDGNALVYCDSGNGEPILVHIYQNTVGENKADTIRNYKTAHNSADANLLNEIMLDVKENFPAKKHGLVMLSHGSGWLPQGALANPASIITDCNEKDYSKPKNEMEIWDLATAIPYELEYLIFDACFMAGIEVAYELKDKVKYVAASSAEVLVPGFVYSTMLAHLLKEQPDPAGVAKDFYDHWNGKSGLIRSATVSVVETAKLDGLVPIAREILEGVDGEKELFGSDEGIVYKVQGFHPSLHIYFDMGDYIQKLNPEKYDEFAEKLEECVIYKANTPSYYSAYNRQANPITAFSGVTIYIPQERWGGVINPAYAGMKWAKAVGTYIPPRQ